MDNNDEVKQTESFLSKITQKNDITRLQIHVLLDYTDFHTKFKDPNKSENDIKTIIDQYTVKKEDTQIPIYMFNFSFRNKDSTPPELLLPNNITYNELTEIIQKLNTKKLTEGGSKKTKRSLPKHKKQKTEKKKN